MTTAKPRPTPRRQRPAPSPVHRSAERVLPTVGYETITPEIALEMLGQNTNNRPIVENGVEQWARELQSGAWQLTHQGIAFDTKGVLLDGQHRLMAIVDTGLPMTMQVTRNLPPEAMATLDVGRKRTAGQILQMGGRVQGSLLAGAVRMVVSYREAIAQEIPLNTAISRARSAREIMAALEKLEDIDAMVAISPKLSKLAALPSPAAVAGALYQCFTADPIRTEEFINGLMSGEGLVTGDARLTLRNRAASTNLMQKRGGSTTQAHTFNLVLGAFRAFSAGNNWTRAVSPTTLLIVGNTDVLN